MMAMPVRRSLIGISGSEQCLLPEVRRYELERNWRASVGETAWQCNRWAAACIERAGVAEEGRDHRRIFAQRRHLSGGR